MIPKFKFYFFPFLDYLQQKDSCRLFDLSIYICKYLKLTEEDLLELTKGGKTTKHSSRVNYCAAYLKKMGLVKAFSVGSYMITDRGKEVLSMYGKLLTLEDLRKLPEYIATQVNKENKDVVYVKPHKRGNKTVGPYICNKKLLKKSNPNIETSVFDNYRKTLPIHNEFESGNNG